MDKDNAPQGDNVEVIVEEEAQEPTNVETTGTAGDTAQKDVAEVSDKPQGEAGSDGKRSSQIINELGERNKAFAGKLIQLAKDNPEAKTQLTEMVNDDPSVAAYIRTKFGSDYDELIKGKADDTATDVATIRKQEYARAEANIILEQFKKNQEELIDNKAASYGFNSEELSSFRANVELLTGAGESQEDAIKKSAIIVNSTKALAGTRAVATPPSGLGAPQPPSKRTVKISPALADLSGRYGGLQGIAKNISKIEGRSVEDPNNRSINGILNLPDIDEVVGE